LLATVVGTSDLNRPRDTVCASSNRRKKIKADPWEDSSKAFTVNRQLSIVDVRRVIFFTVELMPFA